ncbi:enoyl-CoA hydratase/isomerase family protein [Lentibacter algarum]|uniref:enoyl-CoA hydratase/isomerase family protein n=1 Tax=Lentibacter algarum TaxID=576131 RepID=UPI0023567D8E|nr:enoyl-CoA hydratase/isomerase family protein [Lentibacter algarum]MCO4827478.1 hypothetical protein [Lentibacter algarum]
MIRPPSAFISTKIGNHVAVLTLTRPAAGRFSQSLRAELETVLSEIFTTPDIDAIVITGEGAAFDIDLPLAERQLGQASPSLDVLTTLISNAPMPVVAALRGRIADAGLELALAAQARVIHHASRVCLPSLQLGQLPSAAAIYTLTTTLGPRYSIKLLETLADIPISQPHLAPLFDKVVVQNVVGEAAELARNLYATPKKRTPALADPIRYQAEINAMRQERSNPTVASAQKEAALAALEAIQLLPKSAALRFAGIQNEDLQQTHLSRSKTYRRAAKLAGLRGHPNTPAPASLTLVGTGKQARSITLHAMRAKLPVQIITLANESFAAFQNVIEEELRRRVARRMLPVSQVETSMNLLSEGAGFESLKSSDFVIECATQTGGNAFNEISGLVKQIKAHCAENTVLLLTSGMRSGAAEFSELMTPKVAALQLHPDIGSGELAEIALKPEFARTERHQAPMLSALRRLGITPSFQAAQNGLVSSRLFTALCLAAEEAVAQGARPEDVDAALPCRVKPYAAQNAEGQRAQPFRINAFFGDVLESAAPGLNAAFLKAGFEGGKGTSAFDPSRSKLTEEAYKTVAHWRSQISQTGYGPPPEPPKGSEVTLLATVALYAAGSRLIEAGIVATPWELDQIATATLGFTPDYGGPFFEAEAMGLTSFQMSLRRLKPLRPEFFAEPDRLRDMIKNGESFTKPGQGTSAYL